MKKMAFKKHRGVATTPPLGSLKVKDSGTYLNRLTYK